jgi:hypothetical protein
MNDPVKTFCHDEGFAKIAECNDHLPTRMLLIRKGLFEFVCGQCSARFRVLTAIKGLKR